ncbi:hypothetical protein C806_03739 [Lachnospiraceae bacterium 3-1]|nr:hypothetical protein C806_03739 [Lachnospiraceae bacterium 3-1]
MTIKETEQKTGLARSHIRFYDFLWGKKITWGILIGVCFLVAVCSVGYLPAKIPIQWHNGAVSSFADKKFIFAFPAACILIRYVLRPFLWRWLKINIIDFILILLYSLGSYCLLYTKSQRKSNN